MEKKVSPYAIPRAILGKKLLQFLEADVGFGDLSSGLIPNDSCGKAHILAKSKGILAGAEEAGILFQEIGIDARFLKSDGDRIEKGEKIAEIEGNIQNILMVERTALNFLMKLSSIATSTADMVDAVRQAGLATIIAATRKTTPGFGWFEKKAVFYGGGDPHRWNLSDMVMLKDTHLKYFNGDIGRLLAHASSQTSFSKKIELEIENPSDIEHALKGGADVVMLDNMSPIQIRAALESVQDRSKVRFEASGNITRENFLAYAQSGVDILSTSALILHPHISMDFSLRLQ